MISLTPEEERRGRKQARQQSDMARQSAATDRLRTMHGAIVGYRRTLIYWGSRAVSPHRGGKLPLPRYLLPRCSLNFLLIGTKLYIYGDKLHCAQETIINIYLDKHRLADDR
jgi:hypothetical protein